MWTVWWVWVVAGFGLGVLEVLVPGFIFLGFAIGAVLMGVMVGLGVLGGNIPALLLGFAVLSVLAWLVLRATMGVRRGQIKLWDKDINDN
jgi:membrane protein implicated in regulation of membrane protease activity